MKKIIAAIIIVCISIGLVSCASTARVIAKQIVSEPIATPTQMPMPSFIIPETTKRPIPSFSLSPQPRPTYEFNLYQDMMDAAERIEEKEADNTKEQEEAPTPTPTATINRGEIGEIFQETSLKDKDLTEKLESIDGYIFAIEETVNMGETDAVALSIAISASSIAEYMDSAGEIAGMPQMKNYDIISLILLDRNNIRDAEQKAIMIFKGTKTGVLATTPVIENPTGESEFEKEYINNDVFKKMDASSLEDAEEIIDITETMLNIVKVVGVEQ